MNALESPLEALAFNYLTYGFVTAVNNIWAWVAVLTAAVSFWRIRFSPSTTAEVADQTAAAEEEEEKQEPPTVSSSFRVLERQGSTKMKFSLYYEAGEEEEAGEEREEDGGEAAAVSEKWWCDDWEKVMVMRMGDMGWYKWQDTTSLDGSVVRLWEGRRAAAAEVGDVVLRRLY